MATFQNTMGQKLQSVTIHVNGSKKLRLVGAGSDRKPLQPQAADTKIAALYGQPVTGPDRNVTFRLAGKMVGSTQVVAALQSSRACDAATTPLKVSVVPLVVLPAADTTEGMMVRLFITENKSPSYGTYVARDALTSMQWMRLVLENRLARKTPKEFYAKENTLEAIIKADGQFGSYAAYPKLSKDALKVIDDVVRISNDDDDPKQMTFSEYVTNAMAVTASKTVIADPCPTKLYGWRTINTGTPGPRYTAFKSLANNTFFTLDAGT